jgi:hypothetical protein
MKNNRREFIGNIAAASLIGVTEKPLKLKSQFDDRAYWLDVLRRIADPVLTNLAQGTLKKSMPIEASMENRKDFSHLEAFGRLLAGISPWLELNVDNSQEGKFREKYIEMVQVGLHHATNPKSPDYMNFSKGRQPLVDSAFLAQAILRAPNQLWKRLDQSTQRNIVAALKETRVIKPANNNWLLFSAMVETLLCFVGEDWKREPIDYAIKKHQEWYKGDGMYGDGPNFHWDYYNSFVIHPMLIDVLTIMSNHINEWKSLIDPVMRRAERYAVIQERLISPEGTFPPIGRSLAYRFGAFHLLAQIALLHKLPKEISPAQVRCALTAVIRRMVEAKGTFDKNGWLQIGFYGHQPHIGEKYISTGSLYLCAVGLLPLGLPPEDEFWLGKDKDWTSKKIWSGLDTDTDHAISI